MAAMMLLLAMVFGLAVLPQMWVRKTIERHSRERADFPGTGGEFARHILDEMHLHTFALSKRRLAIITTPRARPCV